jgi:hypothetical protein
LNAVENNLAEPQPALAPSAAAASLPGAALAAARVAQGLSLEDIARQLKLSVAQIKSIEADDHSRLPSPVFCARFHTHLCAGIETGHRAIAPADCCRGRKDRCTVDAGRAPHGDGAQSLSSRTGDLSGRCVCVTGLAYYEFVTERAAAPAPAQVVVPPPAVTESSTAVRQALRGACRSPWRNEHASPRPTRANHWR